MTRHSDEFWSTAQQSNPSRRALE